MRYAIARHTPSTIVLERDDRLDETEEILADIARIRNVISNWSTNVRSKAAVASAG
jgi:uncharacterized protein (UPF0276 family)